MDVEKPLDKIDEEKGEESPKKDAAGNPQGDDGDLQPDDEFEYDESAQLNKKKE